MLISALISAACIIYCSNKGNLKDLGYQVQLIDFSEVSEWPSYTLDPDIIQPMVNQLNLLGKKPRSYTDAQYDAETAFRKVAFPTKKVISTTTQCPLVFYTAGHDFDYYFYITCGLIPKNYHVADATGQLLIARSEISTYASEDTFAYKEHLGFYTHPKRFNAFFRTCKRGDRLKAKFVMLPGKDDTYWLGLLEVAKMH